MPVLLDAVLAMSRGLSGRIDNMDCLAADGISRMSGVRSSSCRSIRRPERTALTDEASVVNLISHLIERQLKLSPTLTRDVVVQRELRVPMPNGVDLPADLSAPRCLR